MKTINENEKNWGMLAHLSSFAGLLIPLGNILGPLIVWQVKKDDLPFASEEAKEALNFQTSMLIYMGVSVLLIIILVGFILVAGLAIFNLVMIVLAAISAGKGEPYKYPLNMRFIK